MYAGMTLTELRAEFETRKQQFLDLQANIKRDEEAGVPIRDLDELKKRVADVEKQYKDIEKYLRMFKRPGTSPSQ